MHITFIQTGGTIDKDYPRGETNHGYEFAITDAAVKSILPYCHTMFTYDIVEVAKKDSLDLTDDDRANILNAVQATRSNHIVITHGTDTMLKTAEMLDCVEGKTIVLTGAMLPEKFVHSDARFNVGMAVASAQSLPSGVYVALYGCVVPWRQFRDLNERYEEKVTNMAPQGRDIDMEM
ncbi:asparaginase [Candidatus Kaiserbacteria bacterium]|nr:asparaginase [Candidatus Kaiserbacteria bacterium]